MQLVIRFSALASSMHFGDALPVTAPKGTNSPTPAAGGKQCQLALPLENDLVKAIEIGRLERFLRPKNIKTSVLHGLVQFLLADGPL